MDDASYIHMVEGGQPRQSARRSHDAVYFIRGELSKILNVYGRMVAAGEWRDYAIDHLREQAIFSIFRRASDMPLYRIIKEPALANQQGMWRIMGVGGQILKRGKSLDQLMRYFDRQLVRAVD